MEESEMDPTSPSSASPRAPGRKLARLLRFLVFLCTAGWLFPHVCTEDMDLTRLQDDQSRGAL
jgi:hypothetical protein